MMYIINIIIPQKNDQEMLFDQLTLRSEIKLLIVYFPNSN